MPASDCTAFYLHKLVRCSAASDGQIGTRIATSLGTLRARGLASTTCHTEAALRYFGTVRKLPSGRFQARYIGPDGQRRPAQRADGGPLTFDTRSDAEAWLALRQSEILRDEWLPPAAPKTLPPALRAYADAWLTQRDLEDRTREHYAQLLRDHVYPTFGNELVPGIGPAGVRTWHAALARSTGPTARAHAYDLLRSIMKTAVDDELIAANPCRIRGAGQVRRAKKIRPASLAELEVIVKAIQPSTSSSSCSRRGSHFDSESWPSCAAATSTRRTVSCTSGAASYEPNAAARSRARSRRPKARRGHPAALATDREGALARPRGDGPRRVALPGPQR